ncbi:MAG TPA: hypothetical protein ENI85_18125 [Deltaproteobacteria bacterium]|nr:hypothetical protein [Deltaproteobacteria bacterium]
MIRWALFLVLLLTWPLPLLGLDGSLVPVARYAQLAVSLTRLILREGAGGMVGTLLVLFWVHALVYGALLFGVVVLVEKGLLARFSDRLRPWIALGICAGLVVWFSFDDPYDSQFHHDDAHASLPVLYR